MTSHANAERPSAAVALVTGAGSGIGAATATQLAQAGYRVVCAGRTLAHLEETVTRIGERALPLLLDVTDASSVESLMTRLPPAWRELDVLVNNAGHDRGGRRAFHAGDAAQWAAIIETNVTGLMRVTRQVIEGMIARRRGHVVNVGSIAGLRAYAGGSAYATSKFAVHGFSECLRLDYAGSGIRVTEILPGMVRTNFAFNRFGDQERAVRFYDDFGTCLEAQDVARTVLFAVQQPPHVVISQLVVLPAHQK